MAELGLNPELHHYTELLLETIQLTVEILTNWFLWAKAGGLKAVFLMGSLVPRFSKLSLIGTNNGKICV